MRRPRRAVAELIGEQVKAGNKTWANLEEVTTKAGIPRSTFHYHLKKLINSGQVKHEAGQYRAATISPISRVAADPQYLTLLVEILQDTRIERGDPRRLKAAQGIQLLTLTRDVSRLSVFKLLKTTLLEESDVLSFIFGSVQNVLRNVRLWSDSRIEGDIIRDCLPVAARIARDPDASLDLRRSALEFLCEVGSLEAADAYLDSIPSWNSGEQNQLPSVPMVEKFLPRFASHILKRSYLGFGQATEQYTRDAYGRIIEIVQNRLPWMQSA